MLKIIPKCSLTTRTVALALVPALLLFPLKSFLRFLEPNPYLLSPSSSCRITAETLQPLEKIFESLVGLESYLKRNGNQNKEENELHRQLKEAAERIKRELDTYGETGRGLDIPDLLANTLTAVMTFIDVSFKSDHALSLDMPIEPIQLQAEIDQLSASLEAMKPWMDEKTCLQRDEWLETKARLMGAVMHECNQGFHIAVSLKELLKGHRPSPQLTKSLMDFYKAVEKLDSFCHFWRTIKTAQDRETEATLFKRHMILSSMRTMAIALRRLSIQLVGESTENPIGDENESMMRALTVEMEDARTFINFYLRGVLDLSEKELSELFLRNIHAKLSQKVRAEFKVVQSMPIKRARVNINDIALRHVISNLVLNAEKHGKTKRIFIGMTERNSQVRLQISNDISPEGNGILPYWLEYVSIREGDVIKTRQRLFVETYSTSEEDGWRHGIGLKLCLGLIEAMGGTIRVESDGKQTLFEIILPKTGTHLSRSASGRFEIPRLHEPETATRLPEFSL